MEKETKEQRTKHDTEIFASILREYDKHFHQKNRAANHEMLVIDLASYLNDTIKYESNNTIIDTEELINTIRDTHDRELLKDLVRMVGEYFKLEPSSDRTLAKFKWILHKLMDLSGF